MKNEEAKILINMEIRECKRERTKELTDTVLKATCPITLLELISYFVSSELGISKLPLSALALLFGYAIATVDEPIDFKYSRKEYLSFLRKVKEEIKENSNRYKDVERIDFSKVLQKEYSAKKVNN